MMKPHSAKAKGTRLEKWCAAQLNKIGWKARRQPGSGIYQSFPHDVSAIAPNGDKYILECKSWKNGWRTGDKALGAADMLIIKRDHGEPCVYMPFRIFEQIAGAGHDT